MISDKHKVKYFIMVLNLVFEFPVLFIKFHQFNIVIHFGCKLLLFREKCPKL